MIIGVGGGGGPLKMIMKKINELVRKLISLSHSHVLMVGDYNYPKIDWTSYTSESKHADINFEFIECVRDCRMHQHVTTPARGRGTESPSLLDLVFFSNESEMIEYVITNVAFGAIDHSVLETDCRCHPSEIPPNVSYSYEKADFKKMREMVVIEWENYWRTARMLYIPNGKIFMININKQETHVSFNEFLKLVRRSSVYPSS